MEKNYLYMAFTVINHKKIEEKVRRLHRHIWENKERLWPHGPPDPIDMLHPRVAAHSVGLDYQEINNFDGQLFTVKRVGMKMAGQLDRQRKSITVSMEFGAEIARFTAAHEIGHYYLHTEQGMFRDRPIGQPTYSVCKPLQEREADYYASCFLMPANLVVSEFEKRFGPAPLFFDTHVANHLNPAEVDALIGAEELDTIREFEVAKCRRFNGLHFLSLADQFRVSRSAMAYRLKELRIIRWP